MLKHNAFRYLLAPTLIVTCACYVASWAGNFLVLNDPQPSDILIVLAGDNDDIRLQRGLELLHRGYARDLILDAPDSLVYGRTASDLASDFIQTKFPNEAARIHVCRFHGDSTEIELREVSHCVYSASPEAKKAIAVTSNFHTRRALAIAQNVIPSYTWTAAAAQDSRYGTAWWRHREWAKIAFSEWEKMIWWLLVDRWWSS